MIDKYRVHEVAKDLEVPSKEVLDIVGALNPEGQYKHMTALSNQELDVIFEKYTQAEEVESFDAYFAEGEAARQQKKTAQQAAPAPAPAAAAEKPQTAAASAPARPNAPAQQPARAPQQGQPNRAPQQGQAPRAPQQGQPNRAPQQGQSNRAPQQGQPNRAPQQGQPNRAPQQQTYQQRNAPPRQNASGQPLRNPQQPYQQQRPAPQRAAGSAPAAPAADAKPIEIKMQPRKPARAPQQGQNARPQQPAAPAAAGAAPGPRRTVDMRAAEVDLERYNERYEQIAPTNLANKAKANDTRKQKLNQRSARRGKPIMSRKEREEEKIRRLELERQRRQRLEIEIPEEISVGELAARLKVQATEIIKRLMTVGVMASVAQIIDYDTAALVAMEIGAKVSKEVVVTIEERLFDSADDVEENMHERPPVVVVMGHVDHGKTSLLDAIRDEKVVEGEAGGITQHIGAYQVKVKGRPITFLDTPGHSAFTSMRARGAQVTDIAILVVAADDGIKPQTVEAINHAKAAGVPIIIAINKMDKPAANPEKVKQELTEYELVPEEWGGDVICVPISAKTRDNIDTLLEMVQLVADMKELKANPDRMAKGAVIEARLDKGRGPVATLLVQNGTLRTGDILIAGTALGRVRVMTNDKGERLDEAGPSTPVEITGLADVPDAGDIFNAVEDERLARELVDQRRHEQKEEQFNAYQKVTLDNLFSQIAQGDVKELPIIVKGDVQGSVEAVKQSLEKLSGDEVRVRVIHGGVGAVSESDVMLANASNAIIVGFNVRPEPAARLNADRDGVDIRLYRIIYDAIEEVQSAMKGMLAPKYRDVDLGRAEVRQVYKITNVGTVAGCYVLEGKITRSANIRVVRDGIIIADDKLDSLRRFKDDVKEVATGYECGMGLTKYSDIKEGDIFEAYEVEEYRD